jgi:hypothetical protein
MSSRRKRGDPSPNGEAATAVLDPPAAETVPEPPADPPADRPRPVISFAAPSDRTTRLEVAVWPRVVTVSDAEQYTVYSLTLTRSWRDADGNWADNRSYRPHDVPVLLYLVEQAYEWCLARRTRVRTPDETDRDVPF